jgi:hypothetical protein
MTIKFFKKFDCYNIYYNFGQKHFMAATHQQNKVNKAQHRPVASYTSRIRAIGNSRGVILNNQVIETAGLRPDADIIIQGSAGLITIIQLKETGVNTNLSTWDKQFKAAIKRGAKPEGDLFEGIGNEFDEKEWQ